MHREHGQCGVSVEPQPWAVCPETPRSPSLAAPVRAGGPRVRAQTVAVPRNVCDPRVHLG